MVFCSDRHTSQRVGVVCEDGHGADFDRTGEAEDLKITPEKAGM